MIHHVCDVLNRGGLKLKTFVFMPDTGSVFPTVIFRNPYTGGDPDDLFENYRQFSEPQ